MTVAELVVTAVADSVPGWVGGVLSVLNRFNAVRLMPSAVPSLGVTRTS